MAPLVESFNSALLLLTLREQQQGNAARVDYRIAPRLRYYLNLLSR